MMAATGHSEGGIPALEEAHSQDENEGVREMAAAALAEIDAGAMRRAA